MFDGIIQARWIIPVGSAPIRDGQIVVRQGRVEALYPHQQPLNTFRDMAVHDFGQAAILPGFVNAHTHLELTFLAGTLKRTTSLADWIRAMTRLWPRGVPESVKAESIASGLRQSLHAGVTCIGDIGYGPHAVDAWQHAPQRVVGFLEVLGMGPKRIGDHPQAVERMAGLCEPTKQKATARTSRCRAGLSPHAPYSADATVYQRAMALAERANLPLCTHLAETREEEQFLADGTGPLRELLEQWNLWDGSFQVPRCSPTAYLERLGFLQRRPVIVHANYVSDREMEWLARDQCPVVFCPRSHAFFGHRPHRYHDMLAAGINVCIGTDSLASNDSLSVLDELRFLRRQSCTLSADQLLELGTLAGARALGLQNRIGSLEPGKCADLCVVSLHADTPNPLACILDGNEPIAAVMIDGTWAIRPRE